MFVLRILGAWLVLAALAVLGWELVGLLRDGIWSVVPLGELWAWIHTPSLGLLEAALVRHVSEDLWYDVVFPVLELPAWAVLGVPGLALLGLAFALRRRGRRRRTLQRS